jgi:hypothetical protein
MYEYVGMYVYAHIHIHACMYTCTQNVAESEGRGIEGEDKLMSICLKVLIHVCMHDWIDTFTYIDAFSSIHKYTHTHPLHTCMNTHIISSADIHVFDVFRATKSFNAKIMAGSRR